MRPTLTLPVAAALVLTLAPATSSAQDGYGPAELPPPEYLGQQYADSRGCLFVRAGTADKVLWIPRVTRQGMPMCGSPPSGTRETLGQGSADAAADLAVPDMVTEAAENVPGIFFVAVGSFGLARNVSEAEARLAERGYDVVRGRLEGGASSLTTVFAGPFADSGSARTALEALRSGGFPDATLVGP
jgi:hypothetical protein